MTIDCASELEDGVSSRNELQNCDVLPDVLRTEVLTDKTTDEADKENTTSTETIIHVEAQVSNTEASAEKAHPLTEDNAKHGNIHFMPDGQICKGLRCKKLFRTMTLFSCTVEPIL